VVDITAPAQNLPKTPVIVEIARVLGLYITIPKITIIGTLARVMSTLAPVAARLRSCSVLRPVFTGSAVVFTPAAVGAVFITKITVIIDN
jgi:hypothetical protein